MRLAMLFEGRISWAEGVAMHKGVAFTVQDSTEATGVNIEGLTF